MPISRLILENSIRYVSCSTICAIVALEKVADGALLRGVGIGVNRIAVAACPNIERHVCVVLRILIGIDVLFFGGFSG